jgi:hypothetical protein
MFHEKCCQTGSIQLMVGNPDHGFIGGHFRQRAGIYTVDFKKIQSGFH